MSNLVMWNLIVGFLIPNVIAIVQQPGWRDWVRATATGVICLVAGGLTAYFNGQFNFGDVVGSILTLGVAAITFYKNFWKATGVVQKIENSTSSNPPYAQRHNEHGKVTVYFVAAVLVIAVCVIWLLTWLVGRA